MLVSVVKHPCITVSLVSKYKGISNFDESILLNVDSIGGQRFMPTLVAIDFLESKTTAVNDTPELVFAKVVFGKFSLFDLLIQVAEGVLHHKEQLELVGAEVAFGAGVCLPNGEQVLVAVATTLLYGGLQSLEVILEIGGDFPEEILLAGGTFL